MCKYLVKSEYYAGMGENAVDEYTYNSREELLEVLNNIFKDDIMITSLRINKIFPDDRISHALDDVPQYTACEIVELYKARTDLINALNESHEEK